MVGDYPFDLHGNGSQQLLIKGSNQQTFVEFDCNGFRQMSLDASLVFSGKQLLPKDENGEIIRNENVSIDFNTVLSDWNDLLVAVEIPRFQVVGLKNFSFEVQKAILDQ